MGEYVETGYPYFLVIFRLEGVYLQEAFETARIVRTTRRSLATEQRPSRQMAFFRHVHELAKLLLCFLREWGTVCVLCPTIKALLSQERAVKSVT